VVKVPDEHERTIAFAETALGQIRSLGQPASPRNYEIWYAYASGRNAPLNQRINETLARNGELSEADLEQIYDSYLPHLKNPDKATERVSTRSVNACSEKSMT
jgi:diguanylate cyclase